MNHAESERLAAQLEYNGYSAAPTIEAADLVLINSCVVRESAEKRVLNKLANLRVLKTISPSVRLALTGCLVTDDLAGMQRNFPFIDYFFQAGDRPSIPELENGWQTALLPKANISSFLPVIQGCNNYCSYCIVPYRRGREKSRLPEEVCAEARELIARGTREIVLLGQNVDSYHCDLPGNTDLAQLLGDLNKLEGLQRIRFLTNHPKDMDQRLINAISALDKVCEHVNLPVQSGDDQILQRMGRGYTASHFSELIDRLRRQVPGIAIATDIIVGFPGESEAAFQNTLGILREIQFDVVHVAMYSPRPQTQAAEIFKDDVPPGQKQDRRQRVEALQAEVATEINARLAGSDIEVLVEGRRKGRWFGRSRSDKLVFFSDSRDWSGRLATVKIEHTSPWSLRGSMQK